MQHQDASKCESIKPSGSDRGPKYLRVVGIFDLGPGWGPPILGLGPPILALLSPDLFLMHQGGGGIQQDQCNATD